MALKEAVEALFGSVDAWNDFNSNRSYMLDLTFADLKGVDMRGKEFINCDFSGADLENTNFDNCTICNSDFSNTFFENASLVNVQIKNCLFDKSNLSNSVFRASTISNTKLNNIIINTCSFNSVNINESSIIGSDIKYLKFANVEIVNSNILLPNCKYFEFINSKIMRCFIDNSHFLNGLFDNVDFDSTHINSTDIYNSILKMFSITNSRIKNLKIENCETDSRLDFSNTKIYNGDLHNYDLYNSIFFDTVFINCIWPIQKGTTSIFGIYKASPYLLGHPVQDIKGVSPILRREIADAQYIKEKLNNSNFFSRLGFNIWGATTNFGQSVFRLTIFTVLILLILTIAYTTDGRPYEIFNNSYFSYFNTFKELSYTFFGISFEKSAVQYSTFKEKILIIARLSGFFILALWIGLSANKIGKLSSE